MALACTSFYSNKLKTSLDSEYFQQIRPSRKLQARVKEKLAECPPRTIWTYRNVIGKGVSDRVRGMGIIFAENGGHRLYAQRGGEIVDKFHYIVCGTISFRAHSRGRLAFLHGKKGKFQSMVRDETKILTKVWID